MRFLLAFILCSASIAWAQPSYVTSGSAQSGGFTCTIAGLSVTAGQGILFALSSNTLGANALSISDGVNTYTQAAGSPFTDGGQRMAIWTTVAASTTSLTIVGTNTLNTNYTSCAALIVSGVPASSIIDRVAEAANSSTTSFVSGTTATTCEANEMLVGLFAHNDSTGATGGSGYTVRQESGTAANNFIVLETHPVTSSGNYQASATISSSVSGIGVIVTLVSTACPVGSSSVQRRH